MTTNLLDEVYGKVDFDRELVFKFFTIFSLFEYALKQGGFCDTGRYGEAQPAWDRFADTIHEKFSSMVSPEIASAAGYLMGDPVKKQVIQDSFMVFAERKQPENINGTKWLAVLIRGVRNNLFHGGKFRYDRRRDTDLIRNSLEILECWAHCNPGVEHALRHVQ